MAAPQLSPIWKHRCKEVLTKVSELNRRCQRQLDTISLHGIAIDPFALALCTFICVMLLYKAVPDLAPASLTLDDQWVAALVKFPSMTELFELSTSSPVGFIALQKTFAQFFTYSELSLQILPLLFALLSIVLIFVLTSQITRSKFAPLTAASLLASSTIFLSMATRVKQYSLDALVSLILLWLVHKAATTDKPVRALIVLAGSALLLIFFSNLSLFLGFVAVNLTVMQLLLDRQRRGPALVTGALYNLCTGAIFLFHLSARANDDMFVYWRDFFVPHDTASAFIDFMRDHGQDFLSGALAPGMEWTLIFVVPGAIYLARRHRLLLCTIMFFYLAVFTASALGKFPVGTGRTDIFSYPATVFLIAIGLHGSAQFAIRRNAPRKVMLAFVAGLGLVSLLAAPKYHYPYSLDAKFTRSAYRLAGRNDAIVAFPYANYALGLYGPYDADIVAVDYSTNGFEVRPKRANTYVLPEGIGALRFQTNPEVLLPTLREVIDADYERIVYLAGSTLEVQSLYIKAQFLDAGYRVASAETERKNELVVFERIELQ